MPWWKHWPGRGPWRHLPSWERPGWIYGRGWCWSWIKPPSREDEIRYLEELKKYITEVVLKEIDRRLEELRGK
jgi:hypothetical protein